MEVEKMPKRVLISEVKKLYLENERLKSERDKIWDSVKIFITKISHELKTPLNSIIGFSELLKKESLENKSKDYVSTISICSNHMLELVKSIVDVVKSQYNKFELDYSFFNTREAIEEVIKGFGNINIISTLSDIQICADYVRFKQIIFNLISNAAKFNNKNLPIEIITYQEDNNFIFEIKDYGEGISENDSIKIFDFFVQVSDDLFKRKRGSGIGLSLCKAIVNAHGGNIFVHSEPNKGATFTFMLPIDFKTN